MNKKKIILLTIILTLITILSVVLYDSNNYLEEKSKIVPESYSLYLETDVDTNIYEPSTETVYPSGYILNTEKSYCKFGSTLSWNDALKEVLVSSDGADECYIYMEKVQTFTEYLLANHTEANGLIQHTLAKTTSAGDNNYRYSGGNDIVENYVCFGSDDAVCPKESLYRILGIYNIEGESLVKIIKAHPIDKNKDGVYNVGIYDADTFEFDDESDNRWEGADTSITSDDADINIYLNTTYLNEIPIKYQEMIEPVKLKAGGISNDTFEEKPKDYYTNEQVAETVQEYKIGLMNASDYLYGASESNWNLVDYEGTEPHNDSYYLNNEMKANNWMYLGEYESQSYYEWTIGPNSSLARFAWYVNHSGSVSSFTADSGYSGRPISYLKSTVVLSGGVGTANDPFRLS